MLWALPVAIFVLLFFTPKAEAAWWLLRGVGAAGAAEAAAAGAVARGAAGAAARGGTARSFSNGVARGAGQAVGRAAVNGLIRGGQYYPQAQPSYPNSSPHYYSPSQQYVPQRVCRIVYQRQLIGRQFTHSQVVGVYRTPYGTTVQRRNYFVNHWRNSPVRVCS